MRNTTPFGPMARRRGPSYAQAGADALYDYIEAHPELQYQDTAAEEVRDAHGIADPALAPAIDDPTPSGAPYPQMTAPGEWVIREGATVPVNRNEVGLGAFVNPLANASDPQDNAFRRAFPPSTRGAPALAATRETYPGEPRSVSERLDVLKAEFERQRQAPFAGIPTVGDVASPAGAFSTPAPPVGAPLVSPLPSSQFAGPMQRGAVARAPRLNPQLARVQAASRHGFTGASDAVRGRRGTEFAYREGTPAFAAAERAQLQGAQRTPGGTTTLARRGGGFQQIATSPTRVSEVPISRSHGHSYDRVPQVMYERSTSVGQFVTPATDGLGGRGGYTRDFSNVPASSYDEVTSITRPARSPVPRSSYDEIPTIGRAAPAPTMRSVVNPAYTTARASYDQFMRDYVTAPGTSKPFAPGVSFDTIAADRLAGGARTLPGANPFTGPSFEQWMASRGRTIPQRTIRRSVTAPPATAPRKVAPVPRRKPQRAAAPAAPAYPFPGQIGWFNGQPQFRSDGFGNNPYSGQFDRGYSAGGHGFTGTGINSGGQEYRNRGVATRTHGSARDRYGFND